MPIIKSAKKRVQSAKKAAVRNFKTKRNLKQAHKEFVEAVSKKDKKAVNETHQKLQSAIDTAAKKNVIHKNKASRKKATYNNMAKSVSSGSTKSKTSSAKAKTATKKASPTPKSKSATKPKTTAKSTKSKK